MKQNTPKDQWKETKDKIKEIRKKQQELEIHALAYCNRPDIIEKGISELLEKVKQETEKRHQREVKKINDIVVGAFLEIAGTVWGIDAPDRKWTDRQMTYFNVKVAEIRDKCLDQISQSINKIKKQL